MDNTIIGRTLETLGTVMIAFTALRVHHRVLKEHKMDEVVFGAMKREQIVGIVGVMFVVTGFLLEVFGWMSA
jgi:hypothetical protein